MVLCAKNYILDMINTNEIIEEFVFKKSKKAIYAKKIFFASEKYLNLLYNFASKIYLFIKFIFICGLPMFWLCLWASEIV